MSESIINSESSLNAYIEHLRSQFKSHKYLRISMKTGKQRTMTQNSALHKYCEILANELNDAGIDMKQVLKPDVDILWTAETVKNQLWRPIQKAVTGHDSSTKPKTDEYGQIYEHLSRHLSEKLGIYVAWPSKDRD